MLGGLALALSACQGGVGIPKQRSVETYSGDRGEVEGTIEIDAYGCIRFRLDDGTSYAVIWPSSASQGQDDYVNLGWFQSDLGDGDRVRGTAALTPLADLRGWNDGGYWRHAIGACVEDGEMQAIVFDAAQGVEG